MERAGFAITPAAPRGATQWCLVLLMGVSFLSYPFYVKYFAHSLYQAVFSALFIISISTMLLGPRLQLKRNAVFNSPLMAGSLALYLGYLIVFTAVSFFYLGDGYSHGDLARQFIKLSIAMILFLFLPLGVYKWTLDKFVSLMFAASIAAIVMTVLIFFNILAPLGTLQLPNISVRDTGLREFYGLGLTWGSIPFPGGVTISRLQSFSDEPGTFAFALLPAIVWAVHRGRRLCSFVMSVAMLLTWSVGAVLAGAGLLSFYMLKKRMSSGVLIVIIGVPLLAVAIYQTPLMDVFAKYLETKFGPGENTSVSHRALDMVALFNEMESSPWGFGAGALSTVIQVPLAVGWLRALAEAGVIGFIFYVLSFLLFIMAALRSAIVGKGEAAALGAIVLVLAFAAFQRVRMDESLWHFLLITAFIRFYLARYAVNAPRWLSGSKRKSGVPEGSACSI